MMKSLDLTQGFETITSAPTVALQGASRHIWSCDGIEFVRDDFPLDGASCLFVRAHPSAGGDELRIFLGGKHLLRRCGGVGGWLLEPETQDKAVFWLPRLPALRTLDGFGRITAEADATLTDFVMNDSGASAAYRLPDEQSLDFVVWRLQPSAEHTADMEFCTASTLERKPFFIYASHSATRSAADFYSHLVHGKVYGACWAWPKKLKICDELDALSLHMIACALGRSTGKRLYRLLRRQIVLALLARQEADGSFRHGEWTDEYESHNRLINGAVQLLASEFEIAPEPAIADALKRIANFISTQVDQTAAGPWFLHDSLEQSEEGMRHYPLNWERGQWLGKSTTNLLILNTHLDCMLALARHGTVCDDATYDALFKSAEGSLRTVMSARPAEWLFRRLLSIIKLSLLPKAEQARLPLGARALKRFGWKYVIPRWHLIRRRFPRLAMPDGYIERSLGQADFVHRYHGVHLMDFERLLACPGVDAKDPQWTAISDGLVHFGITSRVPLLWKESEASKDSLAFWAEGLYRRCLRTNADSDHALLADAVLHLHDAGLGLPPSLLGGNGEILPPHLVTPTPSATDERLWVINLGNRDGASLLVVNTATTALTIAFERGPDSGVSLPEQTIAARSWALLRALSAPTARTIGSTANIAPSNPFLTPPQPQ